MIQPDIATLYSQYSKELKGFIRSKVTDADVANDLVQDVFIKAHIYRDKVKQDEKVKPWLYSIARNLVTDHFRKKNVHARYEALYDAEEEIKVESNAMSSCINPMINRLPPVYRDALVEVEMRGTDQKKLAEKLNISYSGAKSRVQRAREMLKNRLLDCCKITADKYGNIVSHTPKQACSGC